MPVYMDKINRKKRGKSSLPDHPQTALGRILRIPDKENTIERQRTFVFLYASLGFLVGIVLNVLSLIGPQSGFFMAVNSVHAALILLFVALYIRRAISVYRAVLLLILSIQFEILIEMLYMASMEGVIMGVPGILGNTILLGMLLILAITAYIRYLPYVLTAITTATLLICGYITQSPHIGHLIPVLVLAFGVLSFMGDRLVRGVTSLQGSKDKLAREQDRVFEFLNIDKEEMFRLIRLTRRRNLSDKQKGELLELLNEEAKLSVLEIAADVVERRKRNLGALGADEFGLTPYEKEICLMILQGKSIADISGKLKKNPSAITTARAKIRGKLGLGKQDNLYEALLKLVENTPDALPAQ